MATLTIQWWHLLIVLAVLALLWLAWRKAVRIDRLHLDVLRARHTLDKALQHRASIAQQIATSTALDPAAALLIASAARDCQEHQRLPLVDDGLAGSAPEDVDCHNEEPTPRSRTAVESELQRTLRAVLRDDAARSALEDQQPELARSLREANYRIQVARRFHNERVTQVTNQRAPLLVRTLHLAGRAPLPAHIDLDDATDDL